MDTMENVRETKMRVEEIWISGGHDFRGRHGMERMENEIFSKNEVECVAGKGLEGDRYFEFKEDFKGQITFFSMEVMEELREKFGKFASSALRRNILVRGADLKDLVGQKFSVQGVVFEGSEECTPCYRMDEAIGKGAEDFLRGDCRGGLRARILTDGRLQCAAPLGIFP